MRRLKRLVLVLSGAGLVLMVGLMLTQPAAPKMAKADSSQQGDMSTWNTVHDQVEHTINESHHHHGHHHRCHHHDDGQYGDQSEPQSEPTVTVTETQQAAQPVTTAQPEATPTATVPAPQPGTPSATPSATPSTSKSSGSLWLVPCTQVGATTTGPDGKTYTCIHSTKYNDTTWHD